MHRLLVLAPLFLACPSRKLPPAECTQRVAELAAYTRALADEGSFLGLASMHPNLVTTELTARRSPPQPSVSVSTELVLMDGRQTARTDDILREDYLHVPMLSEALGDSYSRRDAPSGAAKKPPREVNVLVDADAPWGIVPRITASAFIAGAERANFVVVGKSALSAPPRASNTDFLRTRRPLAPSPEERRQLPKPVLVFERCAPADKLLKSFSQMNELEVEQALLEQLPKAIQSCGCDVDFEAVKNFLWWGQFGRSFGRPDAHFSVVLAASDVSTEQVSGAQRPGPAASLRVSFPEASPWKDVWSRLEAAARSQQPVWLDFDGRRGPSVGR